MVQHSTVLASPRIAHARDPCAAGESRADAGRANPLGEGVPPHQIEDGRPYAGGRQSANPAPAPRAEATPPQRDRRYDQRMDSPRQDRYDLQDRPSRDDRYDDREYDRRRRLLVSGLNTLGLDCFEPRGAFYAFPSVARSGMDDNAFAEALLHEDEVAVVPGTAFGESGAGFVRMCYATAYEKLEEALNRMERFMRRHG